MRYRIYENGELINTIIADENFVSEYCNENGYAYELETPPIGQTSATPTLEERTAALESAMLSMMGVNPSV